MTVYVIARVAVHDRVAYDRYAAGFRPVLQQYGGRLLSADETPEAVEGSDDRKVVLLAFDDRDAALTWANSAEYLAIVVDRDAGAVVEAVLVRGL